MTIFVPEDPNAKSVFTDTEYENLKSQSLDRIKSYLWKSETIRRVVKSFPNEMQADVFRAVIDNFSIRRAKAIEAGIKGNTNTKAANKLEKQLIKETDLTANQYLNRVNTGAIGDTEKINQANSIVNKRKVAMTQAFNSADRIAFQDMHDVVIRQSNPSSLLKNLRRDTYSLKNSDTYTSSSKIWDLSDVEQEKIFQDMRLSPDANTRPDNELADDERLRIERQNVYSLDDFMMMGESEYPNLGVLANAPSEDVLGPGEGKPVSLDSPKEQLYVKSNNDAKAMGMKLNQMYHLDEMLSQMKYLAHNQVDLMHSFLFSHDWNDIHLGNVDAMENTAGKMIKILDNHSEMLKLRTEFLKSSNRIAKGLTVEQSKIFNSRYSFKGQARGVNFTIEPGTMGQTPVQDMAKALDDAFMHRLSLEMTGGTEKEVRETFDGIRANAVEAYQRSKFESMPLSKMRQKMIKEQVSWKARTRAAAVTQTFRQVLADHELNTRPYRMVNPSNEVHDAITSLQSMRPGVAGPESKGVPNIIEGLASSNMPAEDKNMIRTMRAFGLSEPHELNPSKPQALLPDFHC